MNCYHCKMIKLESTVLANLIVRNVDEAIVMALKARAGLEGISVDIWRSELLEENAV